MKQNFKQTAKLNAGQWPILMAAGAMALTPLLSPITVQAAPPIIYRDRPGDNVTLSGVVTRDLAGNQFNFRSDDGRNFRVTLRGAQPNWLSRGDRVQVRGRRDRGDRDVIVASSVNPLNGNGGWNGGNPGESLTLTGEVKRDLTGNQFYFRSDDGRNFRVIARGVGENGLANGDRVQVVGRRDRGEADVINASSVRRIGGNGGWNGGNGSSNSQYGVVTRMLGGSRFEMRAGDGHLILVTMRAGSPRGLSVGDQVRVERLPNSTGENAIFTDQVTIVDNNGNGGGNGSVGERLDFSGTVTSVSSRTRFSVRADNGRVYSVDTRSNLSTRISAGDRVRVVGRRTTASAVRADSVSLISDNDGGNSVNFLGRVESVNNNGIMRDLRVRGDNGVVYSVRYRNLQTFRVGDRVRVIGTSTNGIVNATSISLG